MEQLKQAKFKIGDFVDINGKFYEILGIGFMVDEIWYLIESLGGFELHEVPVLSWINKEGKSYLINYGKVKVGGIYSWESELKVSSGVEYEVKKNEIRNRNMKLRGYKFSLSTGEVVIVTTNKEKYKNKIKIPN